MNAALRAAVIQEWRGLPEKKARSDHWETPGVVLPKLMQKLGLKERLRESEVIDAWSSIVGEFIAAHSAPVALRDGILYVRVLQPSLHYELERIAKTEILRKLKQRFGGKTIRDIPFPRAWCEGIAAQMRGDASAAHAAFTRARVEAAKLVAEQPDYAEALCVLGMADPALGRNW